MNSNLFKQKTRKVIPPAESSEDEAPAQQPLGFNFDGQPTEPPAEQQAPPDNQMVIFRVILSKHSFSQF